MSDREAEYHGWLLREVLFDNGEPIAHREPAAPTPYTEADCLAAEKKWSAPAAPTVVEPVAFVNAKHLQGLTLGFYGYAEIYTDESAGRVPLYTAPPRPAPALTDEEIRDLWSSLCVTPPPPPPPAALTEECLLLLDTAMDSLKYHQEQTRPIHLTEVTIQAIQEFLEKHQIGGTRNE